MPPGADSRSGGWRGEGHRGKKFGRNNRVIWPGLQYPAKREGVLMFNALQLEAADNVATVVAVVTKGTLLMVQGPGGKNMQLSTMDDVPFGHKVALQALHKGDIVVKYGRPIGRATSDIPKGGLVGIHNLEGLRGRGDLAQERSASK